MKLGIKQIRLCIAFISLAVVIGQGIWIYNMYRTYRSQFDAANEVAIENAIVKEHNVRYEQMGGTIVQAPLTHHLDTARYITKTVQLQDTSFEVTHDRLDPYSDMKLSQFILKDHHPINVDTVDQIFREELARRGFPNASTYVEYIDIESSQILQRSPSEFEDDDYQASDLKVIDIFETIGIQAYARVPAYALLKKMAFQLILSIILIAVCVFLLFSVIRTFFWRERVELMRRDSVNAMTHEFKRPISSAMVQAALISHYLKKGQIEKVQQYAGDVVLALKKLTTYTEKVQQLSNNSGEHIALNKENIVLKDFFEAVVEKYSSITEKGVQIALSLTTAKDVLTADYVHFSNIIENLIENAIKYSEGAVSITVHIAEVEDGEKLKIDIKDNGFGIPQADIPHIFDAFYRSKNKPVQQQVGFGLGLTYVKATVEAHDGTIGVASELGTGTEFTLYFPLNDAQ